MHFHLQMLLSSFVNQTIQRGHEMLRNVLFIVLACSLLVTSANAQQIPKNVTNSIGMKFVLIPKGTFSMGAPESEKWHNGVETLHDVTLTKDFYLAIHEVTQGQYEKVMGTNPSHFRSGVIRESDSSVHPVERVSYENAVEFCKRLSDLSAEQTAGRQYRLPTEAEWEYACRAGSKTAFCFGEEEGDLAEYAWFDLNSANQTHPVGKKKANAWGLHDMHGNVLDWCSDRYGDYPDNAVTDPVGSSEGLLRVLRGGSWDSVHALCRSAFRNGNLPKVRFIYNGFRLAITIPQE
jgi:formylglycine-generating enzyme required for sulfatase activity